MEEQDIENRIDQLLTEYDQTTGFPKINSHSGIEKYFNLSKQELNVMTPDDCGEAIYSLSIYSLYIQKLFNTEISRQNWLDANTKTLITPLLSNYDVYSFEERKLRAIRDNALACKCEKLRVLSKVRSDYLYGISQKIEYISKVFNDIKFLKTRQK